MKERNKIDKKDTRQNGSALIGVIVALLVLSVLAISLIAVTESGLKSTIVERDNNSAYYIAEAGINESVYMINGHAQLLSAQALSHNGFFETLRQYIENNINDVQLSTFEDNFGKAPVADIVVDEGVVISNEDSANYSQRIVRYSITSNGTIENVGRTVIASIDVTHKINKGSDGVHPIFDYIVYQGGTYDLEISSGATVNGGLYGYMVDVKSANCIINGDIISLTDVDLSSGTEVYGGVYAHGLFGTAGDVLIRPSGGLVTGNVNAKGSVTLSSRGTVMGSIFAGGSVSLLNTQNSSEGVQTDIHAGTNIFAGNNTHIGGFAYAGGSTNQFNDENVNIGTPPRVAPSFTLQSPIQPPTLNQISYGDDNYTLPFNWQNSSPQSVVPGAYNDLTINNRNTIRFVSGNYYFNNINANQSGINVQLDVSNGPVNIYAAGNVVFGSSLQFQISENGVNFTDIRTLYANNPANAKALAGKVYWEIQGNLTIGSASGAWFGTAIIDDNFTIGNNAMLIGSYSVLRGRTIMDSNVYFVYAPPTDSDAGQSGGDGGGGGYDSIETAVSVSAPIREK